MLQRMRAKAVEETKEELADVNKELEALGYA